MEDLYKSVWVHVFGLEYKTMRHTGECDDEQAAEEAREEADDAARLAVMKWSDAKMRDAIIAKNKEGA